MPLSREGGLDWESDFGPPAEEQPKEHPGTIEVGSYRLNQHRADLMLTWPDGGRVVFEEGSTHLAELLELARAKGYDFHDPQGLLDE